MCVLFMLLLNLHLCNNKLTVDFPEGNMNLKWFFEIYTSHHVGEWKNFDQLVIKR